MQACEPFWNIEVPLWKIFKWLQRVYFFQIFYNKPMVRVLLSWGSLAFMLWLLPPKVGIVAEGLDQFLTGEELWNKAICPSPSWHLALERAPALKVVHQSQASKSINLSRPRPRRMSVLDWILETTFKVVNCLSLSKSKTLNLGAR